MFMSKEYSKAIFFLKKALVIQEQSHSSTHPYIALSYGSIGLTYLKVHQFLEAKTAFSKYEQTKYDLGYAHRNWTLYHALQNQPNQALDHLKKAIQEGYNDLEELQDSKTLDPLREHPKFKKLIKQLKTKQAKAVRANGNLPHHTQ